MDNCASKLASARDVIDAIASVGGDVFDFEATLPGDNRSSLEARYKRAEMEAPKLERQPSTMSKAEEKERGDDGPGDEVLLFIYGPNPDLHRDIFQLLHDSTAEELKKSYKELKEQIDLALVFSLQYQKEVAILFGMTSEHMTLLSPRTLGRSRKTTLLVNTPY